MVTVLASVVVMVLVTALASRAAWAGVRSVIEQTLSERLDAAAAYVAAGDYERAIDHTGNDLLQVIGPDGEVIASTPNAEGLAALKVAHLREVLDDLDFEVEDDEDEGDQEASTDSADVVNDASGSKATGKDGEASAGDDVRSDGDSDDDTDDHDDRNDRDDYDDYDDYDESVDYDDHDDDWGDNDDLFDQSSSSAQATDLDEGTAVGAWTDDWDDSDWDADDDDDDDGQDDDEDDDEERDASDAADRVAMPSFQLPSILLSALRMTFLPVEAHALAAGQGATVTASSVLDTPGPFLVMSREGTSPQGAVSLVAMTSLAPAMDIARNTAIVLGCAFSLLLILVGVYAWTMTGRTLRPVERMRLEVESITAGELGRRVSTPANDPDLAALAITFNGMLSRVESALKEQRRFVSDASHELKSPIAATGLILESLRRCPEGLEDEQVVSDLAYENERLSRIVGDLLTLARSDEGRLVVRREPTDFYDVVLEETGALRRRVQVAVDDSEVHPVIGLSDANHLAHVLRNLLDNAARHACTAVYVSCVEQDGNAEFTVSDDGPGIPVEDRERVFGRFVRLDQGRPGSDGGTGLGLAVTREIVQSLGGTVCFGEPLHGGATAIVRLPLD